MMQKVQGINELRFPFKGNLIKIPHREGSFIVNYPPFGLDTYSNNLERMRKTPVVYTWEEKEERVSFREPTTSESISALAYSKHFISSRSIMFPKSYPWRQLGRIVRTKDGVFVNPPKDSNGDSILDEEKLKEILSGCEKVKGIYLGENDFGFAPYESFRQGYQHSGDFKDLKTGGLARALEHTSERAEKLDVHMIPDDDYINGIQVVGFGCVKEPVEEIVGVNFRSGLLSGSFTIASLPLSGRRIFNRKGYLFGVLDTSTPERYL